MKKKIAIVLAAMMMLATMFAVTGCGGSEEAASEGSAGGEGGWAYIEGNGKLVVGLDDTFAPMGFRDENDKLVGFDIDLANLEYVSSAGLRVLVGAQKLASRAGGELRLLHPSKDVRDIFEMTGLAEIMTIVD